jgi:hypothetical protein
MEMTRAQVVAIFGLTMSIDPKSHITIEEAKDNYDTLFVVTKDQAGSRRWGLPASGGYAAAELAQPSA